MPTTADTPDAVLAAFAAKGMFPVDEPKSPSKPGKRARVAEALAWPCSVPMPPSANNMFLNVRGRGRVPSVLYRKWRKLVIPMMAKYRRPLTYPVEIELIVRQKMRGRSDLDNRIKPAIDCLVAAGVLHDDDVRHVKRVEIRYEPKADGEGVDVWIRE